MAGAIAGRRQLRSRLPNGNSSVGSRAWGSGRAGSRSDAAVGRARRVGRGQPGRCLPHDLQRSVRRQPSCPTEYGGQRLPVDPLHPEGGQVPIPPWRERSLSEVVNGGDGRMSQPRAKPRPPREPHRGGHVASAAWSGRLSDLLPLAVRDAPVFRAPAMPDWPAKSPIHVSLAGPTRAMRVWGVPSSAAHVRNSPGLRAGGGRGPARRRHLPSLPRSRSCRTPPAQEVLRASRRPAVLVRSRCSGWQGSSS
jgi:hypothetical protein